MDTITYEIIRSALFACAREMKIAMMRTAASPIMHSGGDASAAIFDANMQLVAQGNDIPTMLGSAVISTKITVDAIGIENLRPGDVIASNDVYLGGGNHHPDVQLTRPIFVNDEIVAFVMTRGHWTDIGGQVPGSYTLATWDIFGEGVRIPPVLLYRDDKPVHDVQEMIIRNTRDPEGRLLDIQAQYAGTYVGEQRIKTLVEKYSVEQLAYAMKRSLEHSERLMRDAIAEIPDGVYTAEDVLEGIDADNWDYKETVIKVKVTVKGEEIFFDYTGTGPQVRGGINCPFSVTCNSTWFTVKALTDVSIPINQGCYKPVHITAPEGSIVNCKFPASVVSGNTETSPRIIDLLLNALSDAVPDRVIGQSNCAACAGVFSGADPDLERVKKTGHEFISMIDVHAGGMGARASKDGVNSIRVYVGNAGSQPVEYIETTTPLIIESWELVTDSGGAGRYRGGLASQRTYRVCYEESTLTVSGERSVAAPKGYFGGLEGSKFNCVVHKHDGSIIKVPAKGGSCVLGFGDRVRIQPAGSGGYGNPKDRPVNSIVKDIEDGYISSTSAAELYGYTHKMETI